MFLKYIVMYDRIIVGWGEALEGGSAMAWAWEDGWRKVSEGGSSYITATLFNVVTGEEAHVSIRDYDRACVDDCDAPEWYDRAIDHDARRAWCRKNFVITDGSRVAVVKGRKIELGYVGVVERIRKVRDRYGRHVADYVVFEDGRATNVTNCVLVV